MGQHRRNKARVAIYAVVYPTLVPIAKKLGYALTVHGSLSRDMDLIAVPWISEVASATELMEAFAKKLGHVLFDEAIITPAAKKPHGRYAYSILLTNDHHPIYLDIGVMHRHRGQSK